VNTQERQALLADIRGIRVTDWHDAMDGLGLFDRGLMSADIRPLWRDFEDFGHQICGFAFTVRVVPSSNTIVARDPQDFRRQEGEWYGRELRWADHLQPGDLIVVDARVSRDCGFIGSQNSLQWLSKGAVGVVSSGGARDTDEVIKQRVPVYCREFARGISPGRVEIDSYQQPVECGGVYVKPGDLVVADGDGVIVIPAARIADALTIARDIVTRDQKRRANLYAQLGLPADFTLGEAAQGEG
jgi:4-hydroxy-4-methyl-2-oxoglutarate aldolase